MKVVRAVPDGEGDLSDGLVVEASVVGRVLGIRLLTLDASIVIAPAEIKEAGRSIDVPAPRSRPGLNGSERIVGGHLAEAVRFIDESAASLAATRKES